MSQLPHAQFPLPRHPDLLVDHRRARSAAVAEPQGANDESRDRLRWPASFRNGGRDQIGTVADIKSESLAGLRRNSHKSRLGPNQRARLWPVFQAGREALAAERYTTWANVFTGLADALAQRPSKPFDHVVVDEAQDLAPA